MLKPIVQPLLAWFDVAKRDLPWRRNKNPYAIWISEIMLQQTRVVFAIPYFERFLETFPTIEALSIATDETLLKLWEGLGYYQRVRNIKKAAQMIVDEYNGVFPSTYEEILKLPGIGTYTAGAIASMAFDEKVAAVDGNVLRIISRVLTSDENIDSQKAKTYFKELIEEVMPDRAGSFNQAFMDLGASICLPKNPKCDICPLKDVCQANLKKVTNLYPVKNKTVKMTYQEMTVFIIIVNHQLLLRRRPGQGLLAGLYEPLHVDVLLEAHQVSDYFLEQDLKALEIIPLGESKHQFSHLEWVMEGYLVYLEDYPLRENEWFVSENDLQEIYATPKAFSYYLKNIHRFLKEGKG